MRRSTIWARGLPAKVLSIVFWLCVWQAASMIIARDYILASPLSVLARLAELIFTGEFWVSVLNSLSNVLLGFLGALALGVTLAALSDRFRIAGALTSPVMALIHSTPVVSFILLVLLWAPTENVSLIIVIMMVLPVVYMNVARGISGTDSKLLEMARVFRVPRAKILTGIYVPCVAPYFLSACSIGLGIAWKSGVAAEVLTYPDDTIGIALVNAKNFLENADLLAWTLVVILLNVAMEKLVMRLSRRFAARSEGE